MRTCQYLGRHWCELAMSGSFVLIAAIILAPLLR
jgi:hypothetical protein